MKKFAFLLAIVAVFAMSASAFAAGIATSGGIVAYDGSDEINNSFTAGTGNDATGKAYYFGTTIPNLLIGVKLKANAAYSDGKYTAQIDSNEAIDGDNAEEPDTTAANETFQIPAAQVAASGTTKIDFAVVNSSSETQEDKASLTITPTPITFSAKAGTDDATKGVKIKTIDATTIEIDLAGANGTDEVDFTNLEVVSDDTSLVTFATEEVFLGTGANTVKAEYDSGAKTVTLKVYGTPAAGLKGTLTLVGTTSAPEIDGTGVYVAGIEADDVILSIPVETVDYDVKPASTFIWDLEKSGDIVVSLDMLQSVFESVSLDEGTSSFLAVTSADGKMAEAGVTSHDVTVKSCDITADDKKGIEVTIEKAALTSLAPEKGNVVKRANVKAIIKGDVNKTATIDIEIVVPAEEQTEGKVENANADPANALLVSTDNKPASAATISAYVSPDVTGLSVSNGTLTHKTVVDAITASKIGIWGTNSPGNVTPLPIVSADIATGGSIATIVFGDIDGYALVSDDASANGRTVSVNDLNILKLVKSTDVTRLTRAGNVANKTIAQLDGTFNIYYNGALVENVNSKSTDLQLRVYISDDGKYDLAANVPGYVVDPLALVKSTGASHSSSSSCDLGFGLVAVAGLAALALRKRSK